MALNVSNSKFIENELDWFQNLLTLRIKITFERSSTEDEMDNLQPPSAVGNASVYAKIIGENKLEFSERLILILALIPHVKPSLLDVLYLKNKLYDIPFTEFGGLRLDKHKGFLPTGETAMFLLAGDNIDKRLDLISLFSSDHVFYTNGILVLDRTTGNEPQLYGTLNLSKEYISKLTTGKLFKPDFGPDFPAKLIYTEQVWEDLVVNTDVEERLKEIENYVRYGKRLKNEFSFGRKIQPGFKVLFTGPSGTGKTLSATLLGKRTGKDVYKVDLSLVVSKYIGETEKNLSRIFDQAESKDWILFFDEADALFGKRSNTSDAHDRYANQEVSFLLQRMETFDGLVILCSNFKDNIDDAFFRRFQLVIDFHLPAVHQRVKLWSQSITKDFQYASDVDIYHLSESYELSAASIVNVLHYCILKCLERNKKNFNIENQEKIVDKVKENIIHKNDIISGLKIEMIKEGKSIVE